MHYLDDCITPFRVRPMPHYYYLLAYANCILAFDKCEGPTTLIIFLHGVPAGNPKDVSVHTKECILKLVE